MTIYVVNWEGRQGGGGFSWRYLLEDARREEDKVRKGLQNATIWRFSLQINPKSLTPITQQVEDYLMDHDYAPPEPMSVTYV
jgi:hypothetical protein